MTIGIAAVLIKKTYDKYKEEAHYYACRFGFEDEYFEDKDPCLKKDAFRHAYASAAARQDFGHLVAYIAGQGNEVLGDINGNQGLFRHQPATLS